MEKIHDPFFLRMYLSLIYLDTHDAHMLQTYYFTAELGSIKCKQKPSEVNTSLGLENVFRIFLYKCLVIHDLLKYDLLNYK